jgi:multidrug efflux pump subunit AcrB
LPEISGVDISGYLRPELQIKVDSESLKKFEVSMDQVKNQVLSQNVRRPIGSMKDKRETEVSIVSELDSISSLENVIVTSGYQGQRLKLNKLAKIVNGFEDSTSISKIQGSEGIIFNVQKTASTDILTAQKAVVNFVDSFKKNNLTSPVDFVLIDDESYDVKNRLELIGSNGLIGFILIIVILFVFLDFRSGIWVGMGIPFSLAFTMLGAHLLGYTLNNMTLAAIIIVLGIVVDDAIIVAENISSNAKNGSIKKALDSVVDVGAPVIASVLTTCAAFVPLYFFSGRFGLFVKYIPTVIFLMLLASIIESFFFLPSHMIHETKLEKFMKKIFKNNNFPKKREKMISKMEAIYVKGLVKILNKRIFVLLSFVGLLVFSVYLFRNHLSYVMFPREESRDFRLKVITPDDSTRVETAQIVRKVEDIFLKDGREIVTSVRTSIGQNRRGGEVRENEASIRVEIVAPSERSLSLANLLEQWKIKIDKLEGLKEVQFQKNRFGSDSGSPIAVEIQENNDQVRFSVVTDLKSELEKLNLLTNIEEQRPVTKYEYRLEINKNEASRLGIQLDQLGNTLRAYIEGDILYTLNNGEEEVDVRFTSNDVSKEDVNKLLDLTVANSQNYLVPIRSLVTLKESKRPSTIERVNFKRATMVYADIAPGVTTTPLEIAAIVESKIFPIVLNERPSTNIKFRGEVEDSRESQSDFSLSIFLVLAIIYLLLIFLFDSFFTPLLIGAIIPFGVIGTVIAFWAHGLEQYGFFAVIGTLGMIGVVINDSIVLIDRLGSKLQGVENLFFKIAEVSSTRLRAIIITTITTVAGLFPTAYGLGGYDSMLSEMMLAMGWGLLIGMFITLILVPCIYSFYAQLVFKEKFHSGGEY